ncbi:hypothetical protein ACN47E_009511 [Coniothyrium glycines]
MPTSKSSSIYLSAFLHLLTFSFAYPTSISSESGETKPVNRDSVSLNWTACPAELNLPKTLQCATYAVPIDWDEPNGQHFDLGLVKLPAPANSTRKIRSLFINPGGPGGRASDIVAGIAVGGLSLGPVSDSFDIIGLDPRGVGLSQQIQCNMSIYAERVSLFPQNQEDLKKLEDKNKRLGASCRELSGPLFDHLDTISSAKDHEAVRVALGNEPINFLGLSYGSQLGAQYAALFPDHIRTIVLDGILQHSLSSEAANLHIETTAYELGMTHFFDWASKNESSILHGQNVELLWTSLVANATKTPIPALSCNGINCPADVNGEEILFNAHNFLTFAGANRGLGGSWEQLAAALYNASQGDASMLSTPFFDPTGISFLSIGCLDWPHAPDSIETIRAMQTMTSTFAPFTRGATHMWTLQLACRGWPVGVKNPPKKLDIEIDAPIVVVQSTADPSTGMPWAIGLLEEIENAVLVTREGDGHTSFPLGGEAMQVITKYLLTAESPRQGIVTIS